MTHSEEKPWDWDAYLTNGSTGADIPPHIRLLDLVILLEINKVKISIIQRVKRMQTNIARIHEIYEWDSEDDVLERASIVEKRKRRILELLQLIKKITEGYSLHYETIINKSIEE